MAHASINLSYIGQPGSSASGGQIIADQTSGPKAKTLFATATVINGSGTWSTETNATINFIDGVNTFGKTVVLPVQSVGANAGTTANANYNTVGPTGQIKVGDSVTVGGFANSANNGTFTVQSTTSSYVVLNNGSFVTETNPAGTITDVQSAIPVWVDVFMAGTSGDSATAQAAANSQSYISNILATSFTLNHQSFTTTGVQVTYGCIIAFSQ